MTGLLYLAAAVAFILGLKRLSSPRTARSGNHLAAVGMLLAVVVTLVNQDILQWGTVIGGLAVGTVIGLVWARRVPMTAMPQMVAALNGFGGLASALVVGAELEIVNLEVLSFDVQFSAVLAIVIGTLTASGSAIAFGKLQGIVPGRPVSYRGQQAVNSLVVAAVVLLGAWGLIGGNELAVWLAGAVGLVVGVIMVLPIGGADMPVVVSLLNSLSGLAAAGTGFAIGNSALIIGGSLVGSAGLILTMDMCEAMNRSLANVLFSGFGAPTAVTAADAEQRPVRSGTADDVAIALAYAQRVMIIPGYGLAVAQAQHDVRKLATQLENRGVEVVFAIHPVAGRMPGHMNVLLAEADVPYEHLIDLETANEQAPRTDVVLVLGANDVVNPSARDDASSPIHGMPIIEADRAATVVVVKRSLSPGYAGIDNPLFYNDRTMMFFADAREALASVSAALALV